MPDTFPAISPLARYRFDFTVETPLNLPEYAGSALRGAFGNALRRAGNAIRLGHYQLGAMRQGQPNLPVM